MPAARCSRKRRARVRASCSTMKAEMHALEDRLGDSSDSEPEHEAMLHRYSDLQDRFRLRDGYSIELKTATVLQGLGFKPADFERPTETFSGGWQMRIALAQAAARPARTCCCSTSRPTTSTSRRATGSRSISTPIRTRVILVSHDRFFLDAVVTRIADLTLRTLTDYVGNYSRLPRRARRAHRGAAQGEARAGRRSRARQDVHRSVPLPGDEGGAGAEPDQDARQGRAASRCRPSASKIHFNFPACAKSGRTVIELKHARKALRRHRACFERRRACTSSAATASRSSDRTASASRR